MQLLTFLFTDLVNSTVLWEQFPDVMRLALAQHDELLRKAVEAHQGRVVKTTGDGLHAVFNSPVDGVAAALSGQQAISSQDWGQLAGSVQVRMGLHTGESHEREGDYYGPTVNLAARVMGAGNGRQILLSSATAAFLENHPLQDCGLADLGEHRLKGIPAAQRLFCLTHPELPAEYPAVKTLGSYKHNLPQQLSTFVGREKELEEVCRLLQSTRLLTLLGPGGTGKTRLMRQAAEEVIENYPDGVWLVELAPLTDPALIPERVAATLNIQEQPGRSILDTAIDYLRRKKLLLLLDNVEHLVRESAEISEHLLAHCPELAILVTGREALFIEGETTMQIESLSMPEIQDSPDAIGHCESVRLFIERATSVRPSFSITPENAAQIAEVVRRLDGIPLALELAAARLRMLTIDQIKDRLDDRFRLLTGGRRTALPRQQTLQALIDWSWKLLDDDERALLRRLSVFSAGWTLEAAQQVCSFDPLDEFAVFDLLEQLINKSLVTVHYPPEGEARYGMLESIRQFSQEKMFDAGEGETVRDRHADYFAAFAEEAEYHLPRGTMVPWVNRIIPELDNLRAVMAWTLEDRPLVALHISSALLIHWAHWIHPTEARSWLEQSIKAARPVVETEPDEGSVRDFIKAHIGMSITLSLFSENEAAHDFADRGIQMAKEHEFLDLVTRGVGWKTASFLLIQHEFPPGWIEEVDTSIAISERENFEHSLYMLYMGKLFLALMAEDAAGIQSWFQKLVEIDRVFGNPRNNAGLLQIRARMAMVQGDLDSAKIYLAQAEEAFRSINDQRNVLHSQSDRAHLLRMSGEYEEALQLYRKAILKWQEEGSQPAIAHQLECFAYLAIVDKEYEKAASLLGAAGSIRRRNNAASTDPNEISDLERAMALLAEWMGEEERDKSISEGAGMTVDEAITLALNT